jgi:hypothetical protein
MAPAFKTGFQLGKDSPSLIRLLHRAMDTFNNEEGYHARRTGLAGNDARNLVAVGLEAALAGHTAPAQSDSW